MSSSESDIRTLRKYRQQSLRRLHPAIIGAALVLTVIVIALRLLLATRFPLWIALLIVASIWFQVVGDWINVRSLNRRIASIENGG